MELRKRKGIGDAMNMTDYGLFVRQAPDELSVEEFREWNRYEKEKVMTEEIVVSPGLKRNMLSRYAKKWHLR